VSVDTIDRLIKRGELSKRIISARTVRIPEEDVRRLVRPRAVSST
jgi:predicted site-specific integrase-resolvase